MLTKGEERTDASARLDHARSEAGFRITLHAVAVRTAKVANPKEEVATWALTSPGICFAGSPLARLASIEDARSKTSDTPIRAIDIT